MLAERDCQRGNIFQVPEDDPCRLTILINYRFLTVLRADRIYVLEGGQIIEHGCHAELMALNSRYSTMFHAQADV